MCVCVYVRIVPCLPYITLPYLTLPQLTWPDSHTYLPTYDGILEGRTARAREPDVRVWDGGSRQEGGGRRGWFDVECA